MMLGTNNELPISFSNKNRFISIGDEYHQLPTHHG